MQLTREQVTAGIAAGLALTNPEGDVQIPMKYCAGALVLREILINLGNGSLALIPAMQQKPPPAQRKKNAKKKTRKKANKKRARKKK